MNAIPARYEVRASANLVHWLPVSTNHIGIGGMHWNDPESMRHPRRFYRVVAP